MLEYEDINNYPLKGRCSVCKHEIESTYRKRYDVKCCPHCGTPLYKMQIGIENKTKEKCINCPDIKLEISTTKMWIGGKLTAIKPSVECANSSLCNNIERRLKKEVN